MRKLAKPTYSPEEVFRACISQVEDADLKHRLESCEPTIITASEELESKVLVATLHTIATSDNVSGHVTAKEMGKVYTDRMAHKKGAGRKYYDKLISSPAHGQCPLCGHGDVYTLDHHLPKSLYPSLAVAPLNLVPACRDCNATKSSKKPTTGEEETIHPYFDDIDSDYWLQGKVVQTHPAAVTFHVRPPAQWGDALCKRIKYHFSVLNLATLYASQAARELGNIRGSLRHLFATGGKEAVSNYLKDAASSRAEASKNSWQTAMYMSLAIDDWFCEGGFEV